VSGCLTVVLCNDHHVCSRNWIALLYTLFLSSPDLYLYHDCTHYLDLLRALVTSAP